MYTQIVMLQYLTFSLIKIFTISKISLNYFFKIIFSIIKFSNLILVLLIIISINEV